MMKFMTKYKIFQLLKNMKKNTTKVNFVRHRDLNRRYRSYFKMNVCLHVQTHPNVQYGIFFCSVVEIQICIIHYIIL